MTSRYRQKDRLDYRELHRTGRKVLKDYNRLADLVSSMASEEEKLKRKDKSLALSITECLGENALEMFEDVEDIDDCVLEMKSLRDRYRNVHVDLECEIGEEYKARFSRDYTEMTDRISEYIKAANSKKKFVRIQKDEKQYEREKQERFEIEERNLKARVDIEQKLKDQQLEVNEKLRIEENEEKLKQEDKLAKEKLVIVNFNIERLNSIKSTLERVFGSDLSKEDDYEILEKRKNLNVINEEFRNFSEISLEILKYFPSDLDYKGLRGKISEEYTNLSRLHSIYIVELQEEVTKRDLNKEKLSPMSVLNIKLDKFTGYDSAVDIYTFQDNFEKLYLSVTQKKRLPDLLKNNYLDGTALVLVKEIECIDEIWKRLKRAFGNSELLLRKKLYETEKCGPIWKIREPKGLINALSKLNNAMTDLGNLAAKHSIENDLYHSSTFNLMYELIGEFRKKKFISETIGQDLCKKEKWKKLQEFLVKEISILEEILLSEKNVNDNEKKEKFKKDHSYFTQDKASEVKLKCHICGKNDHKATKDFKNRDVIQYFACKTFVEMSPKERFEKLREKDLCHQCLAPGAYMKNDKRSYHKSGKCFSKFVCKDKLHNKYNQKKHVLVCEEHKNQNDDLFEKYKTAEIVGKIQTLEDFSKQIKLSYHSGANEPVLKEENMEVKVPLYVPPPLRCIIQSEGESKKLDSPNNSLSVLAPVFKSKRAQTDKSTIDSCEPEQTESFIYMLQRIIVGNNEFSIFFDSGCGDLVNKKSAVDKLGSDAELQVAGPLTLNGVGNVRTISRHGIHRITLPLYNGNKAILCGITLDQVTARFPTYTLSGKVQDDIHREFRSSGGNPINLPKLFKKVGGETDFMLGIKYLKYFPREVFYLPSGLTIYESVFLNPDGSRGVVGGPHSVFTAIEQQYGNFASKAYLNEQLIIVNQGYQINPDVSLLNVKPDKDLQKDSLSYGIKILKCQKAFENIENAGTEVNYRCISCRNCADCKKGERIELISLQDEYEQNLIDKSIEVDIVKGLTLARLPFVESPEKLVPNKSQALSVYRSQVNKLNRNPQDKEDVIKSEKKLQDLGFVESVSNLSESQKCMLKNSKFQNYIPWRAVWNVNSISTPCRLVFDASHNTSSGRSLNSLLAKGANNMNKLVEIVIRWTAHMFAFHCDVQKMYNTVRLREEHWCFQRYLWNDSLDQLEQPKEKIIKTLIYGVRSSGNQAEKGLRETALQMKNDYPEVSNIVRNDVYVDDCLSGSNDWDEMLQLTDQLKVVLSRGGFALKGVTIAGSKPPENLSSDGQSVKVAGMKWYTESDELSLDITQMNFSRKVRGKKPSNSTEIPVNLTRRHCVGKVAEVFDILGRVTPIIALMKIDLRILVQRKLSWDDKIPIDLRPIWESNFKTIQDLGDLRFSRAVVPVDAKKLEIQTIETGDASKDVACSAAYARIERQNGEFSCQLVFARSKLLPENITVPRGELYAAWLNSATGHIVRRSFGDICTDYLKLTDSQVAFHWINSRDRPLKQWVRNKVIEINRLSDSKKWRYVKSKDMIADIATRRGAKVVDVNSNSDWINGYPWMRSSRVDLIVKTYEEIKVDDSDLIKVNEEMLSPIDPKYHSDSKFTSSVFLAEFLGNSKSLAAFEWCEESEDKSERSTFVSQKLVPDQLKDRYRFCNYMIDPNKFRLRKVVRILAFVLRFIKVLKERVKKASFIAHQTNSLKNIEIPNELSGNNFDKQVSAEINAALILSDDEIRSALRYFFSVSTSEIKKFNESKFYEKISEEVDGILFYKGRILADQEIVGRKCMSDVMLDLSRSTFCVPLVDSLSPFAYSIVNEVHWYNSVAMHTGVETVLRYTQKYAHIIEGRQLVKKFRKSCKRCRHLEKKYIKVLMGPVSKHNLNIAPAFYISQTDLFGPLKSYSSHNKRMHIKVWFVVFCCCTTGAVSIKVMEDYSTSSFLLAFKRFSSISGYPKMLLPDEGSQLIKGCSDMKLNIRDIRNSLSTEYGVEFETCPVGGHNVHGRVERKIRHIQDSIERSLKDTRLSVIQWETVVADIANCINDLPLGYGSLASELENLDIITPNRLILGRNNDRSPSGPLCVTSNTDKIIEANNEVFRVWYECWLTSYVPLLMQKSKWLTSDRKLTVGDVVLFKKKEKEYANQYQYGIVKSVKVSKDEEVRRVNVEYQNHNEKVKRITDRAVRDLIMIHPVDEPGILFELNEVSKCIDLYKS